MEFACKNSVSAPTGLAPNEVHMVRLPRYQVTILDNISARGHQFLERDQLEYCNFAVDRHKRAYELVREQHSLNVSRMERRNAKLSDALYQRPRYNMTSAVGCGCTIQRLRPAKAQNKDPRFKAKISLNWTGPFKILAVGPCDSAPDRRPVGKKLLYLNLPSDMPGADAKRRVAVERCKPCTNPHDNTDMPRFLPADLTPYIRPLQPLDKIPAVSRDRRRCSVAQRMDVDKCYGGVYWGGS